MNNKYLSLSYPVDIQEEIETVKNSKMCDIGAGVVVPRDDGKLVLLTGWQSNLAYC